MRQPIVKDGQLVAFVVRFPLGRNVDLKGTGITSLPDGVTFEYDLDLRGLPIHLLPEDMTVKGSLYLSGSRIPVGSYPESLKVGGQIVHNG